MANTELLNEYVRCLTDIAYYGERYCEAFDQTRDGMVPLKVFPKQKELLKHYQQHKLSIVLKPRQAGVSTVTALFVAHKILFSDKDHPVKILVVANKLATANEFIKKIKGYIESRPAWLNVEYGDTKNKSEISIVDENGAFIGGAKASATSIDALRGYTPTHLVMDEAAFIANGAELWGSAGASLSCVNPETTYLLTDNGLTLFEDFLDKKEKFGINLKSNIICDENGELTESTLVYRSEPSKTVKLKTKLGFEIECTEIHKFRDEKFNWIESKDIKVGTKLTSQFNQNIFGQNDELITNYNFHGNNKTLKIPNKITDDLDFGYLLGLFLAEGNYNKSGIQITNSDNYIINFLTEELKKFNIIFKEEKKYKYRFNSHELRALLLFIGFDKVKAPLKIIPRFILQAKKEVIIPFLQGLFDGDGCASKDGNIFYSTTSKNMAKQLQLILLNLGIISTIKSDSRKPGKNSVCTNKDKITITYRINIYGKHALKFYNEIGFRLERKQIRSISLLNKKDNSRVTYPDRKLLIKFLKDEGHSFKNFRLIEKFRRGYKDTLSFETIDKLLNILKNKEAIKYLEELKKYYQYYYIDEVESVENGYGEMYDIHVPKNNSYFSNGLISHNTGGGAIFISTPNGLDPLYYETYEGAKKGDNDFKIFEMQWWQDPRFNFDLTFEKVHRNEETEELEIETVLANKNPKTGKWDVNDIKNLLKKGYKATSSWFRMMSKIYNGNPRLIAQELEGDFLGSGDNVFGDEYIKQQELNVELPIREGFFDNNLRIWEDPIENNQYMLAGDVSRGDSDDYSTIQIWNVDTGEQAAEWVGKVPPDKLGEMIYEIGIKYLALAIIDITGGMGQATIIKLLDLKYPWLYYSDASKNNVLKNQMSKYKKNGEEVPGFIIGSNRILAIQALEIAIRTGSIVIKSDRLISELRTFVWINGKPDHQRGKHDDLLISVAMILFVFQHSFKNLKRFNAQTVAMLNAYGVSITTRPSLNNSPVDGSGMDDTNWFV